MAQFDAAAATAAYLAQLPAAAHAKAQAYTQGGHWLLLWGTLVSVAVAWIVLKTGILVKVRERIEATRPRPGLTVFIVVVVCVVHLNVFSLPWSIYADWWRETQYGLSSQSFAGWFDDWAIGLTVNVLTLAILFSLIYLLIRRAPRRWWLWAGGLTTAFAAVLLVLGPVLIEPLFNHYTPAPPGPVRDAVVAMARANGVPSDRIYIYDGSKQSNRYTANVSGLFGTARVAMSDVMFKKNADLGEVKAVVGHEMGHYKSGHMLQAALFLGLMATIGFFLIDRLFPWGVAVTQATGATGLADPAGFPVIAMLVAVMLLLGTPLANSLGRWDENEADRFSLARVNEPDGLARALVKSIEYRAASPSRLEEFLFYDHPAVSRRIRQAMDWEAAHMAPSPPPTAS